MEVALWSKYPFNNIISLTAKGGPKGKKGQKGGVERQMSLPKTLSKDKLNKVTKKNVQSKFKP